MARKPIEHERVGLRTPRERIWQAVREMRHGFTARDLASDIRPSVRRDTVRAYLTSLAAAGYLATFKPTADLQRGEAHVFRLVKDSFEAPRVDRQGQPITHGMATLAMWRAMRALGSFDHNDVARAASLGKIQVSVPVAKTYLLQLHKAGYFRVVKAGRPNVPTRYQLVRYTGAEPPAITSRKCVFDRNLGEFTWQQPEQEVCDDIA